MTATLGRTTRTLATDRAVNASAKFFILFIIRYQNIGSTFHDHSSRVRRTPFLLRFLTHCFHNQRCVRSFSSQKREEPLVRPRNDDVWELSECGNSILYWWRATTRSDWRCRMGNLLQPNSHLPQLNVNFLSQDKKIAGLKEGLGVVVLAL